MPWGGLPRRPLTHPPHPHTPAGQMMQLKPLRGLLMRSGTASQAKYAMPADYLFCFDKPKPIAAALDLTNRLTG